MSEINDFLKLKAISDSNGDIMCAPIPKNIVQLAPGKRGGTVTIGIPGSLLERLRNGEVVGAAYFVGIDEWNKDEFNVPPANPLLSKVRELRQLIWGADIPSPACPEYVEWHENCLQFLKFIDEQLLEVEHEDA